MDKSCQRSCLHIGAIRHYTGPAILHAPNQPSWVSKPIVVHIVRSYKLSSGLHPRCRANVPQRNDIRGHSGQISALFPFLFVAHTGKSEASWIFERARGGNGLANRGESRSKCGCGSTARQRSFRRWQPSWESPSHPKAIEHTKTK